MGVLKVLTLNLWHRTEPYAARLAALRAGIAALDPDVIGLQEVVVGAGASQLEELSQGTPLRHATFAAAHAAAGGAEFGNAILSRYPLAATHRDELPACGQSPRSVASARVATPWGSLPFFSTHLHYHAEHGLVREEQALELAQIVDARARGADLPAVVTGDFNAPPDAAEIRFLRGLQSLHGRSTRWFDAFEYAGVGPGVTFDEVGNPFAAAWPDLPARIDYVFVRAIDEQGRGRPRSARVVLDAPIGGVFASDHYGVLCELDLGER